MDEKKQLQVKLDSLKSDLVKESEGEWIDIPDWPGVAFFSRAFTYGPYTDERDEEWPKVKAGFAGSPVPQKVRQAFFGKLYAKHLLLNWRGLDTPYTPELAAQLLPDEEWRKVYAAAEYVASKVGDRAVEYVGAAEKNSA